MNDEPCKFSPGQEVDVWETWPKRYVYTANVETVGKKFIRLKGERASGWRLDGRSTSRVYRWRKLFPKGEKP